MSKGGLGFSRSIDSNFRKLLFRDFIPKLVQNNTVIDDEYEGIQQVMIRANHVMAEMEKDGMEFVSIQTMIIPKGDKTRTSLNGKKSGQVSLCGRYRFDSHSKHPVDCFQIVRIWYRQGQGGIGLTKQTTPPQTTPKSTKNTKSTKTVTFDGPKTEQSGNQDVSNITTTTATKVTTTTTVAAIATSTSSSSNDSTADSSESNIIRRNALSNIQTKLNQLSKRLEELETKVCLVTRNQQMPSARSSFRTVTDGIAKLSNSFTGEDASPVPNSDAIGKVTERLSTLEKKFDSTHKKDQKIYMRLAEEINKNTKGLKHLETSMNAKIKETGSRLWTSIQALDSRMGEQALKQSVKVDSLFSQLDNMNNDKGSMSEVTQAQTHFDEKMKEVQEKISLLDKTLVKMRSEEQDKSKQARSLNSDISTIEDKVNKHEGKLRILESKTNSIMEQKKSFTPKHSTASQGLLGSVLRNYSVKTKRWKTIRERNPDEAAKTLFGSIRPVLHSVATGGGKSVLIITCNIPTTTSDDVTTLRYPLPNWMVFDSHSLTIAKGAVSLHNLRNQLGTTKSQKSANPELRQMLKHLEKYIQGYQNLYRFVAYVDLPVLCFESMLDQKALHLASNIFLENVLDLEIQVDVNEKKEVTGDNVFMRESDENFPSRWKKHRALLKKEEKHLVFQPIRCSWK